MPASAPKAARASSARDGWQCMSPAAAIRRGHGVVALPVGAPGSRVRHGRGASAFEEIESTLKKGAAALRDGELEFALAGSVARWARGAPQTRNDLDFLVRPEDAEAALRPSAIPGCARSARRRAGC